MHAASSWLLTLIGMLLLVLPCAGPPLHAATQSRNIPETRRPAQAPPAQRPPSRTVEPLRRFPQQPPPPAVGIHQPPCVVPYLEDFADARTVLGGRNLRLGDVKYVESDRRPGTVLDQSPKPRAQVRCGSEVNVVVATRPRQPPPPPPCRVPDLLEDHEKTLEPQLAREKLRLGSVQGIESDQRAGTVVRQAPSRGADVRCGSAVDVWIAIPVRYPDPPPPCSVPDLLNDPEATVEPQLAREKLRPGRINTIESDQRAGTVVRQAPARGVEVKCGSQVDVWIAVPFPPKPDPPIVDCRVPDLIEDSEPSIEPQLARAKLYLGNVTGQESNQRPGTVVRQLPPRGTTVKCESRVDVWIAVPPKPKPDPPKPDPPRPDPPKPDPPKPDPPKPDPPKHDPPPPAPVRIVVPRLEGRDQMAATRMLEAVGLHVGEVGRQPSDGPRDTVVQQSPVAGTPVQPGAPVQIWLAAPRPATVPELRGRDRAGAAEALTSARLVLGEIGERPSDDPSGTVVGQSPSAGTVVRPGLPVQVWFAVPIPIEVPVLVGRREADAAALLRDSRLRAGEIRFRESIEPRGVVVDQAPQAGRRVNADSTVDLWVAMPRRTLVPDVRGRSQRAAADALRQAGLVVGDVRERESQASRGTVTDQQPVPGVQVEAGTAVSLSIASPVVAAAPPPPPPSPPPAPPVQPSRPALVRVPAVVDMPLTRAFVVLQDAGLRPGRISEIRATTTAGTVTTQFPAAGTDASPGAQVDLIVAVSMGVAPWFMSQWILGGLGLGLMVAVAGSLMRTKTKTGRESTPPSVSFAPHADAGVQSTVSEDGVLTRSEFRLESRPDKGIQALHGPDRLVAGET